MYTIFHRGECPTIIGREGWAVGYMGYEVRAWNTVTGEEKKVTPCSKGDCVLFMDAGVVVYNRYGEDDLTQFQLYSFDLNTDERVKLTNLRPYFDDVAPLFMKNRRVFWSETRGRTIVDECGGFNEAEGRMALFFWKDL